MPAAFLNDPEADDVLEEADGIAKANLVGELERARLVIDDGLRPFDTDD